MNARFASSELDIRISEYQPSLPSRSSGELRSALFVYDSEQIQFTDLRSHAISFAIYHVASKKG